MNKRQKKKAFKKRFGFNPPKRFTIRVETRIAEHRLAEAKRLRKSILDLLERIGKFVLELAEELKKIGTAFITATQGNRQQRAALEDFQTKVILQQRQQEREVKRIESNFNISNHDRR